MIELPTRHRVCAAPTTRRSIRVSSELRVAREIRFNERVSAEFSGDFFNLLNRVNVTDLNTVYGATTLSAPPNPVLGFKSPRDASNPFQFQYGLKLRF